MTRRILLTGAAGRVARQLLPGLDEHELRLLDRSDPRRTATRRSSWAS